MRLNAKELRLADPGEAEKAIVSVKRRPIYLILENIYDTYNVGGLFRLADALAVEKIYLCGQMEIPPNPKIKKASIGTYKIVPWVYKENAIEAIAELKAAHTKEEVGIYAIEQHETSVPYNKIEYQYPTAFIVGNETFGVTAETLAKADKIIEIPMWGVNKSLNVIVSAAIVTYHATCTKSP